MKTTKVSSYSKWIYRVRAEADRVNLSEKARKLVTGPMLRDGFEKHETPEYFVSTLNQGVAP